MTVLELMQRLKEMDPDAEVIVTGANFELVPAAQAGPIEVCDRSAIYGEQLRFGVGYGFEFAENLAPDIVRAIGTKQAFLISRETRPGSGEKDPPPGAAIPGMSS